MKKFKTKFKSQGGFTLIEMLIVVAIIAILVAVSIPIVNTSLERARIATDAANERAAKAAVLVEYLTNPPTTTTTYYYNAVDGSIGTTEPSVEYGKCSVHKDGLVTIEVTVDGDCTVKWINGDSDKAHGTDATNAISITSP